MKLGRKEGREIKIRKPFETNRTTSQRRTCAFLQDPLIPRPNGLAWRWLRLQEHLLKELEWPWWHSPTPRNLFPPPPPPPPAPSPPTPAPSPPTPVRARKLGLLIHRQQVSVMNAILFYFVDVVLWYRKWLRLLFIYVFLFVCLSVVFCLFRVEALWYYLVINVGIFFFYYYESRSITCITSMYSMYNLSVERLYILYLHNQEVHFITKPWIDTVL